MVVAEHEEGCAEDEAHAVVESLAGEFFQFGDFEVLGPFASWRL